MGGKGELVKYAKLFKKKPISENDKRELLDKMTAIIEATSQTITIVVLVEDDDD